MAFLDSMAQTLERGFMPASIRHTRTLLLAQDERTLAAAGISRELLERGVEAWPWRLGTTAGAAPGSVSAAPADAPAATGDAIERTRRRRLLRAARELERLDDRALARFGIGREDIARALDGGAGARREAA